MFTLNELKELGRNYQGSEKEMTPRVLFIDPKGEKDATVKIGKGLIIAVTEVEENVFEVVLKEPIRQAELIEHGKWKVTKVDGSQCLIDVLKNNRKELTK